MQEQPEVAEAAQADIQAFTARVGRPVVHDFAVLLVQPLRLVLSILS
jgi:hypothetical protein